MTAHHSSPVVPGDLFARHQTITGLRALTGDKVQPCRPRRNGGDYEHGRPVSCIVRHGTEVDHFRPCPTWWF
ncbi:hypothetical protein GCM10010182_07280 [Actinomadura cremea]|nr:hypothetical protein GCM10010182_07280 [Actinomadura cremea]